MSRISRTRSRWLLAFVLALAAAAAFAAPASALTGVDLSTYKRVGRYDLPEPTRTAAPANNLLGQEASGVAYDWDTDTLFVVGDGGTSVTQVSKTGALIDTMTLPPGGSAQGTEFYDTEGIAYVGNGEFVLTEERDRQAVRFTYEAGGTLTRSEAKTVKLGTSIGNVGLEGLTNDPVTGGYIFVKEMEPMSIFQTGIDWNAGTATNGGPTAVGSTDLFNPSLTGLIDLSDVFALANVSTLTGPQTDNLLIISQESGRVVNVDRSGKVASSLTLVKDAGNPLSIQQQTHEGVTMDDDGILYTVNESGGGDADHPQLWVFEPSSEPNKAPTAVALSGQTTSLPENTNTSSRLKLADVVVTDDGIGTNQYSVTGADAGAFEVDSSGLYLKAGTALNAATKSSYSVTVQVVDATVSGSSPVTAPYTLTVTPVSGGSAGTTLALTEVSPWSSGNSPYAADWWELTNTGTKAVDLTGWKVDDESASFGAAVSLSGVTALAPGESAIFIEGNAATAEAFKSAWFAGSPPAGFKIGTYSGSGIGLGTGGDQLNVFNGAGTLVTGVSFGSSTTGRTFDNTAALGAISPPLPAVTTLSTAGVNGAVTVGGETGSPGVAPVATPVIVSEVAPWGSSDPTYGADWWELTNRSGQTVDLTGWEVDDESNSFAAAVALNGVSSLAPGKSAIFVEGDATKAAAFKTFWFGSSVPAGFLIGTYSGSGVGLGSGGDQLNVFNAEGARLTGVKFGSATTNVSFDNAAGLGSFTAPPPTISTLSKDGVNGAFVAHDQVGSPGSIAGPPPFPSVKVTEVSSTSSSNATYKADWFELTNTGTTTLDPSAWKVDDDSSSFASALALSGVTALAAGESAVFIEGNAATAEAFRSAWFGGNPPAGFKIGTYSGSGIGFSSGGDQVNIFNAAGTKITGVRFGAGTSGYSFDNAAGAGGTESPPPPISTLSVVGTNGAFAAGGEVGSPGTIVNPPAAPPVNLVAPSLSGGGRVGQPLTCAPGTWTGTPAPTFGYTWLRNGQIIGGAGAAEYTPVVADLGKPIRCRVTATNSSAAVNAPSNTIQISQLRCTGADIAGAGSTLQRAAHQEVWGPAFAGTACNEGTTPEVSYDPVGSGAGLDSWGADGSGALDTGRAFIGTDEAPDAEELANVKAAAGGSDVAVIPVAQTAIALLANPPAGCTVEAITNSNLAGVMEGRIANWSKVEGAEGSCNAPITRVVRGDDSGTTAQFKSYLLRLNPKGLLCTTGATEGRASWAELANTAWPEACPEKTLSQVLRPGSGGGIALVDAVDATPGAIGYAALPDALAAKDAGTAILDLQNNGQRKAAEATFASPGTGGAANCSAATYQVPVLNRALNVDWSGVFSARPAAGGANYPLCALTYALALADYSAAGFADEGVAVTAYDYLRGYALAPAGQSAIAAAGYAPLPGSGLAQNDVLGAATRAATAISW